MKLKSCLAIVAGVLMLAPAAFAAKDLGTPVALPDWGTVTIPTDLYITEGDQPMLTAGSKDASTIAEDFYPIVPKTYQLIQKDDAVFQYGVMLHYSTTVYDLNELLGDDAISTDAITSRLKNKHKNKLELGAVAQRFSNRFSITPPAGFRLVQPVTPVKANGKTFYEGVVAHDMAINDTTKTELIHIIGWQHGSIVEVAAIMGDSYNRNGIIKNVTTMLESAKNMKK